MSTPEVKEGDIVRIHIWADCKPSAPLYGLITYDKFRGDSEVVLLTSGTDYSIGIRYALESDCDSWRVLKRPPAYVTALAMRWAMTGELE